MIPIMVAIYEDMTRVLRFVMILYDVNFDPEMCVRINETY